MKQKRKPVGYWTRERCIESAQGYDTINAWMKAERGAYNRAKEQGWFDECVAHMEQRAPAGHWDIPENVLAEARKHATRGDWFNASQPSYKAAKRLGIFEECTAHMGEPVAGVLKYTKQDCFDIASRYTRRKEFIHQASGAYGAAKRYGIAEECMSHMPRLRKLTKDVVAESASKFGTIGEWQDADGGAYNKAWEMGWLGEVTAHMERQHRNLTKALVLESASRHMTVTDWRRADASAEQAARDYGWLEDATAHMERTSGHDNDAVYSWVVTSAPSHVVMPLPGYHLVKSGVTSQKLGDKRPRNTMRNNSMQGEIIAICDTSEGDAPYFEQVLLSLGVQPVFPDIEGMEVDGKTEFRLISDDELNEACEFLGVKRPLSV